MKQFKFFAIPLCLFLAFLCVQSALAGETRIQQELLPGLHVDAAAEVPEGITSSAVMRAVFLQPDAEAVKEAFRPGDRPAKENVHSSDGSDTGDIHIIYYEDDASILTNDYSIRYQSKLGEAFTQACALEYVLAPEALEAPDLTFASRKEAEDVAAQLFKTLEIPGEIACTAIYALPHERMQAFSEEIAKDPENADFIDMGKMPLKLDWAPEEDCYWMTFAFYLHQLRIDDQPYQSVDGVYYAMPTSASVLVTSEGIQFFEAKGLYRILEEDEPQPLLTQEQALDLLKRKYENVILTQDRYVDRISLCYLPTPTPGKPSEHRLVPTWRFRVCEEIGVSWGPSDWASFDAVTGQEM